MRDWWEVVEEFVERSRSTTYMIFVTGQREYSPTCPLSLISKQAFNNKTITPTSSGAAYTI